MKRLIVVALIAAALASPAVAAQVGATRYTGGMVWTGEGFARRDLAVAGGRFVDPASLSPAAAQVDLGGRFVTPGFANAHAHITEPTEAGSRGFTDAGVFYVWNPNTVTIGEAGKAFYGQAGRYRVKIAQGGITEPRGHPERLYVEYLAKPVYGGKPRQWFVGNAFHYGATPAQIDDALTELTRQKADLVKIYLLDSERYSALRADPKAYGGKGLDPVNVAYLVTRAHALGLSVAAHVETAHDLKMAALAGVDVAAHLPGYSPGRTEETQARRRLTPEIAALVARSGMKVVPTYALIRGDAYSQPGDAPLDPDAVAIQAENLRLLRAAGVPLLIGTDGRDQIWSEVEHLAGPGDLPALEVVKALFATGPALFPERRIGCFETGCEADFLVLEADPLVDIGALRRIERRVLGGIALPGPDPGPASAAAAGNR